MKNIFNFIIISCFFLGKCNAADCKDDQYTYKPKAIAQFELNSCVVDLDLSNLSGVDDNFIKKLSEMEASKGLININLSGTDITEIALTYILGSNVLGTRRELPQISGRYSLPSSEVYLDVSNCTKLDKNFIEHFSKPVKTRLQYMRLADGAKIIPDMDGIKLLKFRK